jgi:hypothetical protein
METYGEVEVYLHAFLTLALATLPLGKRPQYALDRRPDGSKSWSGCSGKEKNSAPDRN